MIVEEHGSGPRPIAGVSTSLAAFVGYGANAGLARMRSAAEVGSGPSLLHTSLQLFFANGGTDCFVVTVSAGGDLISAIDVLKSQPEVSIVAVPDAAALPGSDCAAAQKALLAQCALLRNRFAILDACDGVDLGRDHLGWGAAYYPWLNLKGGGTAPPSGAVAGVFARVDATRGVWKVPANVPVEGVMSLAAAHAPHGNEIRSLAGQGIVVWGARTLADTDPEWRYVSVRRTMIFIEQSLAAGLQWVVFEPNEARAWAMAKNATANFLTNLWRQGALQGTKPEQAFAVRCGLGETMTAQDILNGVLVVEVMVALLRPAEFLIVRMRFSCP